LIVNEVAASTLSVLVMCCNAVQIKETPEAPALAKENLAKMGPMSAAEKITLATISGAVVLWMFGEAIGCPAVLAAMLALGTLLVTGMC
jgi:DASS family divalent anion:Na+ symporter